MKKLILIPIFNEYCNLIKLFELYGKFAKVNIILFDCNSYIPAEIKNKFHYFSVKDNLFTNVYSYVNQNLKEKIIITTVWNIPDEIEFDNLNFNDNILFLNSNMSCEDCIDFELFFFRYLIDQSKFLLNSDNDSKEEFYKTIRNEFLKANLSENIFKGISLDEYSYYIRILNNESYANFKNYNNKVTLNMKYINKEVILEKINDFNECGLNFFKRNPQLIVSLTSFPERIHETQYTIYSLLNQKLKPDKVILWLAKEQFPNRENDLPDSLLNLKKNGLTIDWCNDIKSYKKLIPTLKEHPNDYIVTVDDDIYYPENWLEHMWKTSKEYPNTIISSRARSIKINDGKLEKYLKWKVLKNFHEPSYLTLPTGSGGTLYCPNALSELVFDESLFNKLCPSADDIWFWAMAVLNKTKITCVENPLDRLTYVNIAQEVGVLDKFTLWQYNQNGHNDNQMSNIINYFPKILEIIVE